MAELRIEELRKRGLAHVCVVNGERASVLIYESGRVLISSEEPTDGTHGGIDYLAATLSPARAEAIWTAWLSARNERATKEATDET